MKKLLSILTVLLLISGVTQAVVIDYQQGFETDLGGLTDYGGTAARVASGSGTLGATSASGDFHAEVGLSAGYNGAYTYGPGKTALPADFGVLTQSFDVYIDPQLSVQEEFQWDCEVLLRDDNGAAPGDWNYVARKLIVDAGTANEHVEYRLGRNSNYAGDDSYGGLFLDYYFLVEEAGWFTFTTQWIDDGTNLINYNNISQDGTILFEGYNAAGLKPSDATGYESGYIWFFGRMGASTTLGVDNVQYSYVPEPATLVLMGIGATLLRKRRA